MFLQKYREVFAELGTLGARIGRVPAGSLLAVVSRGDVVGILVELYQ